MKHRILSLLLTGAVLLAGCGGAVPSSSVSGDPPSDTQSASQSEPAYIPVYTYVDPAPDMVLAVFKSGDETIEITYENYRLTIDTEELFDRNLAIRELAVVEVLKKDLAELKIEIDEQAFLAGVNEQITLLMSMGFADILAQMLAHSDLSEDAMTAIIREIFRPMHLGDLMYRYYEEQVARDNPRPEMPDNLTEEDEGYEDALTAIQEWETKTVREAEALLNEYQASVLNRIEYGNSDEFFAIIDGEKIVWDQEKLNYIEFYKMSSRINNIAAIHGGEAMLIALQKANVQYDGFAYESGYSDYIEAHLNAPEYMAEIDLCLDELGATRDDYFLALHRTYLLQFIAYDFMQMLINEYDAIPADDPTKAETIEDYYNERYQALLKDGEIVNVTGR